MQSLNSLIKQIGREVQLSVVATDIVMTIYVLWLIVTDTAHWLPGVLFSWTPIGTFLLLRANKLFHLCIIHKLIIIHSTLVYMCCVYQAYFGFGCILYPMRWLMFISGLYLMYKVWTKRNNCIK